MARVTADSGREWIHRLPHLPLHVQLHHHRVLGIFEIIMIKMMMTVMIAYFYRPYEKIMGTRDGMFDCFPEQHKVERRGEVPLS